MKKKLISSKLFKVYIIFFSIFLSALLLFFTLYVSVDINKKIINTQEQMQQSIIKNIDNFFDDMNDFSMTLVNSKEFKTISIVELSVAHDLGESLSSYFRDMYLIAFMMIEKGYKVGVYTHDGYYIWLGNNYFINKSKVSGREIYSDYRVNGYMNIHFIENNPFLEEYLYERPNHGISTEPTVALSRTVNRNNIFNKPEAMLEVHVPYEELEVLMEELNSNKEAEHMRVFLYNNKGDHLYSDGEFEITKYMENGEILQGEYRSDGNIINIVPVISSNLYMVSVIPYAKLYSGLIRYVGISIAAFIVLNVLLMLITYRISIRITTPIKDICTQIENMDLRNHSKYNYKTIQTDIYEIDILNTTIHNMQRKISNSLEEIVRLQSFEIQSKMLALQSQMQPHFLYNTLMIIAALSEEKETEKVSRICYSLTHMLRYIASESTNNITISDEIKYVDQYMNIIQERFENTSVQWNIPLEMIDIIVPKLIIQPLVENSLKYNEQCSITINGTLMEDKWLIQVLDNGIGFKDTVIQDIMKRCEKISKNYRSSSLNIDGMGLPNIYIRLKLLYGERMHFSIGSNQEGGACVEIGGHVRRFDDEQRNL